MKAERVRHQPLAFAVVRYFAMVMPLTIQRYFDKLVRQRKEISEAAQWTPAMLPVSSIQSERATDMNHPSKDFDRRLNNPMRLAMLDFIDRHGGVATFPTLMQGLGIESPGLLSHHLIMLQDADYLTMTKEIFERRARTTLRITDKGATALAKHLAAMASFIGVREPAE